MAVIGQCRAIYDYIANMWEIHLVIINSMHHHSSDNGDDLHCKYVRTSSCHHWFKWWSYCNCHFLCSKRVLEGPDHPAQVRRAKHQLRGGDQHPRQAGGRLVAWRVRRQSRNLSCNLCRTNLITQIQTNLIAQNQTNLSAQIQTNLAKQIHNKQEHIWCGGKVGIFPATYVEQIWNL